MHKTLLMVMCCWVTSVHGQTHSPSKNLQERRGSYIESKEVSVRLKCSSPVTMNDDVLFVVDGIPKQLAEVKQLNPDEIESISILKGSAESIVTCRPMKGVIAMTLKKHKNTRLKIIDQIDSTGVSNATVRLTFDGKTTVVSADDRGEVLMPVLPKKQPCYIAVSSVGYLPETGQVTFDSSGQTKVIQLKRNVSKLESVIVSGSYGRIIRCGGCWTVRCIRHSLPENEPGPENTFLVFPNPAPQNANVTILPKHNISGYFQVLSAAGQILHTGIINHTAKQPLVISTSHWAPGIYFIRLKDNTADKIHTEKFIIQ